MNRLLTSRPVVCSLVFLVALAVYAVTLAPTVTFWDAGEFIATSHILGIPHPPGTPLFVLLGRVWDLLPFPLSVAVKLNLLSAVAMATAAAVFSLAVALVLERVLGGPDRLRRLLVATGGGVGALLGAFTLTVWDNATETEVYAVATLLVAIVCWLTLRWREEGARSAAPLYLAAYLCGLGVGVHLLVLLPVLPVLLFVFLVNRRLLSRPAVYGVAAALFILGLSTHLYLYIRAGLGPPINEADPSSWGALWDVLTRKQYGQQSLFDRPTHLLRFQLPLYLEYLWSQFAHPVLAAVILLLAGFGCYRQARRDRPSFFLLGSLFLLSSLGLVLYLNLKLGYSQAMERFPDPGLHEVRERDYFFLLSFFLAGLWAGIGLAGLGEWVGLRLGSARLAPALLALFLGGPVAAQTVINLRLADRSDNYAAADFGHNLLASIEPGGVLFTNGDNDTFPLWYLQEVEGFRQDVVVINLSLLNTDWYIRQLRDGTIRGAAVGEAGLVVLSDQEIVELRPLRLDGRRTLRLDQAQIEYPAGQIFRVQDMMVLHVVQQAWGRRRIYFALTVPDENRAGLDRHLVLEGMVLRLDPAAAEELPASGFGTAFDPARSDSLLWQIYRFRGLEAAWAARDDTARKLLTNYGLIHWTLARHDSKEGEFEKAMKELERSRLFLRNPGQQTFMEALLVAERQDLTGPERVNALNEVVVRLVRVVRDRGDQAVNSLLLSAIAEGSPLTARELVEVYYREGGDPILFYRIGDELLRRGDRFNAKWFFSRAIRADHDFREAYYELIRLFHEEGNRLGVVSMLQLWGRWHPADAATARILREYEKTGELPEALLGEPGGG